MIFSRDTAGRTSTDRSTAGGTTTGRTTTESSERARSVSAEVRRDSDSLRGSTNASVNVQDACTFDARTIVAISADTLGSGAALRFDGDVSWAVAEGGDGCLSSAGVALGYIGSLGRGAARDLWSLLAWMQLGWGCRLRQQSVGSWTLELSAETVLGENVLGNGHGSFLRA